jgi:predicted enzyme related to lactoylglutathione lyase
MSMGFVWFHNASDTPEEATRFYEELLGWKRGDGPPGMTMLGAGAAPFAAVAPRDQGARGWVPYVQVDDLAAATERATALGGKVLTARTRGPAGEFTVVSDPGGATLALWQKA